MNKDDIREKIRADDLMTIIDAFIRLQLIAEKFPKREQSNFIIREFRKYLTEDFAFRFGKRHPVYLNKIKNNKSGPYAKYAFKPGPLSLLNL